MKKGIKITYDDVSKKEPEYNIFTHGLQKKAKEIGNRIAFARFDLNALVEIYKTPHILETFRKHHFLILSVNAIDFKYIVSIHKLYNHDEAYSLMKLINALINDYRRIDWFQRIKLDDLRALKAELETSNKGILKEIKKLRDKRYVHEERIELNFDLNFDDLVVVQETLERIYNSIRLPLDGTSIGFDMQKDNTLGAIIKRIVNVDRLYHKVLDARSFAEPTMKTEDIYNTLISNTHKK